MTAQGRACHECGGEIGTSARWCPKCGARVPRTKWWLWIPLALLLAFFVFGAVVSTTPAAKERAAARQVIELCWEEQQRKSIDPPTQRFVASTCEMLERDFTQKYGVRP